MEPRSISWVKITVERLEIWLEKDKTKNNVQTLLFSHININSLSAHFDNYLATTQKLIGTADFLAISETKFLHKANLKGDEIALKVMMVIINGENLVKVLVFLCYKKSPPYKCI